MYNIAQNIRDNWAGILEVVDEHWASHGPASTGTFLASVTVRRVADGARRTLHRSGEIHDFANGEDKGDK